MVDMRYLSRLSWLRHEGLKWMENQPEISSRAIDKQQDFTRKIAIILDKTLESWQAFNAATHIAAYIGNALGENFSTGKTFITRDSVPYPRNTQYPLFFLRAKRSQL